MGSITATNVRTDPHILATRRICSLGQASQWQVPWRDTSYQSQVVYRRPQPTRLTNHHDLAQTSVCEKRALGLKSEAVWIPHRVRNDIDCRAQCRTDGDGQVKADRRTKPASGAELAPGEAGEQANRRTAMSHGLESVMKRGPVPTGKEVWESEPQARLYGVVEYWRGTAWCVPQRSSRFP